MSKKLRLVGLFKQLQMRCGWTRQH